MARKRAKWIRLGYECFSRRMILLVKRRDKDEVNKAKDFSKFEIEQGNVMDTLPRVISIIEKKMTKNPAFVQRDIEHSVNSVDDEAHHRADHDDSRRCSHHC